MNIRTLLFLCFLQWIPFSIFAQKQFEAQLFNERHSGHSICNTLFTQHTIFQLDQKAIKTYLNARAGERQIDFSIGKITLPLALVQTNLLATDFEISTLNPQSAIEQNAFIGVQTYRGYNRQHPEQIVRLTISEWGIEGVVETGDEQYIFLALHRLTSNIEDRNKTVLYRPADLLIPPVCDQEDLSLNQPTKLKQKSTLRTDDLGVLSTCGLLDLNTTSTKTSSTCKVLQIAADVDTEYINNLGGGVFAALAAYAAVVSDINSAEALFSPYGLSFQISKIRLFYDANSPIDTDPYPDNIIGFPEPGPDGRTVTGWRNEMTELVENIWATNIQSFPYDLALIYTGVPICETTSNCEGACPNAYASSNSDVCSSGKPAFAVIGQCTPFTGTLAHEIGHNFEATHASASACGNGTTPQTQPCAPGGAQATIMCAACSDRKLEFDDDNHAVVLNRIENLGACLNNTKVGEISGPSIICVEAGATYELTDWTHIAGGNVFALPEIEWAVGFGLSITNNSIFSIDVVSAGNYIGPSYIEASIELTNCTVTLRRDVYVNAIPIFDCLEYEVCQETVNQSIIGRIPQGYTLEEIKCINCPNNELNITIVPPAIYVQVNNGQTNQTYWLTYSLTGSCGTFTGSISIRIDEHCGSGPGEPFFPAPEQQLNNGSSEPNLTISPNPSKDRISIQFKLVAPSKEAQLTIYDLSGKQVVSIFQEETLNAGIHQRDYDLSTLPSGTYLLQLITEQGRWIEKLVKL